MFAFAFRDANSQTLLLARDPFGMKPLFFQAGTDYLLFASECRALQGFSAFTADLQLINEYLFFGNALPGKTLYDGVFELLPGEYMVVDRNLSRTRGRYFFLGELLSEADGQNRFRPFEYQSLGATVIRHMHENIMPGICLSGGLDSGAIAAALREGGYSAAAFSMGFGQSGFDESAQAMKLAAEQGLECRRGSFPDDGQELSELVAGALSAMDGPFGDPSFVPTCQLSRFVSDYSKVVLSGDGGDEIFYGYPTFAAEFILRRLPLFLRSLLYSAGQKLGRPSAGRVDFLEKIWRLSHGLRQNELISRHAAFMSFGPPEFYPASDFFAQCCREIQKQAVDEGFADLNPDGLLFFYYFRIYLANLVLIKTDRASMASSLEVRNPFLDIDFIKNTFRFPPASFPFFHKPKAYLRQYLKNRSNLARFMYKKRGFSVPLGQILPVIAAVIAGKHGFEIPASMLQSPHRYFVFNLLSGLYHHPHSRELRHILQNCFPDFGSVAR
jgi:asparagine synthase (glutamine-hydrolysing)